MKRYDVIVLGAGAAGLMAAARAGQNGRSVLVVDHAESPGKKILISGGGRCNFTNLNTAADTFISANPHFAKSALARYAPRDFLDLVERYGIAWHEKTLGQLFCDGSAKQIVNLLIEECRGANVDFAFGHPADGIKKAEDGFKLSVNGRFYAGSNLIVATGGPSIPKLGATGFAYDLARQFGLKVVEPRPALVPFTLANEDSLFKELSGVATETIAKVGKAIFREASLFTHKGLSGPAMLQVSSYWRHGQPVHVDLLPNIAGSDWLIEEKRKLPKTKPVTLLAQHLPERLAQALVTKLELPAMLGDCSDKALRKAGDQLSNWSFLPNGTEGFAKAEVTVGGVSTAELSSSTMEARCCPSLYFIGEAVDVTGWLGGYNFQWAWASGVAAGDAV
ncbi:MAG: NAD(P)/FAD-dependent oxidoreductase [Pseudomonadota bacterium]